MNDHREARAPTPTRQTTLWSIRRTVLLALPIVLAQLAQVSMTFVDTLMVGRLGPDALAAIALGSSIYSLVMMVCMGVLFAISPQVSQAYGADDVAMIGRATRQGLWLALGLTVVAVLVFQNAGAGLLWMGQDPEIAVLTAGYLRAISWGFVATLGLIALRGLLEGIGDTRPLMVIGFIGVGLNVVANQALMFGRWGLPALGLVGTGWATSIVFVLMFVMAAVYVQWRYPQYRVFSELRRPDPSVLRELFVVGWPIGLTLGFEAGLFATTALLMGLVGTTELAAHQIALQTASFAFMVPVGVSAATAVRVGQAVGRRDADGARLAGFTGMGLGTGFMSVTACLFLVIPEAIIGLYLDVNDPKNAAVVEAATRFLSFAAMFQLVDGLQVCASGALRGLKDTRVPMLLALLSYWLVGMGVAVGLTFGLGVGGWGLWMGLVAGLSTAACLLSWRFNRQTRRRFAAVAAD
ncbi:MAG: MATE family efflux transporter [Trueperaceae bacterium]|nr:MATE family efflux transporter [Trueperaceae bacterium]